MRIKWVELISTNFSFVVFRLFNKYSFFVASLMSNVIN